MFTVKLLGEQQPLLVSAGIKGLSLIGSAAPLVLPETVADKMDTDESPAVAATDADALPTRLQVGEAVLKLLKSAHTRAKSREDAAVCLGYLAIGDGRTFAEWNLRQFLGLVKLVSGDWRLKSGWEFVSVFLI